MKSALSSFVKNANLKEKSQSFMKEGMEKVAKSAEQTLTKKIDEGSQKVQSMITQGLSGSEPNASGQGSVSVETNVTEGEEPATEFKNINKKENSKKIGKIVKQKFDELNDTSDVSKVVFAGLEKHLYENKNSFSKQMCETLRQIVNQYMVLSVYANEEKCKRILFTNIVHKCITFIKKANQSENPPLIQNIGLKLYNIMVIQNQRGGDATNTETDTDTKMKCFVSDRTDEIIQSYFDKNVHSQHISDELIFQLCKRLYALYNDENPINKKKLSQHIDSYIDKFITKTANTIADFFPENKTLETLYILLDDVVIQGFIKEIGDNHPTLQSKLTEKTNMNMLHVLETIHGELNRNVKSKAPVYFLEHLNTRISQALKTLQQKVSGGDTKISLAPTDYSIDDIIVSIVDDAYKTVKEAIDTQLTEEGILDIFTKQIGAYFRPPLLDNLETEFSGLFGNILHCIFERFNPNFYLHVFYVSNFEKTETPIYNALFKTIPHFNKNSIHKTSGLFGEYPFISETIYEFKSIINTKTDDVKTHTPVYTPDVNSPVSKNDTSVREGKPSLPRPDVTPNANAISESAVSTNKPLTPASAPVASTNPKSNTIQTGGKPNNYTIYSDNPKKMIINNTIYDFIHTRILQCMYSSKFENDVLFNNIHEHLLKTIDAIKPMDAVSYMIRYGTLTSDGPTQFIQKSISLALREFQKNPKMFTNTKFEFIIKYIFIVMEGLLHEYLYTNVRSTRVSLQLNMNAFTVFFNTLKPTFSKLYTTPNEPKVSTGGGKSNKRTRYLRQRKQRENGPRRFSKKNTSR